MDLKPERLAASKRTGIVGLSRSGKKFGNMADKEWSSEHGRHFRKIITNVVQNM